MERSFRLSGPQKLKSIGEKPVVQLSGEWSSQSTEISAEVLLSSGLGRTKSQEPPEHAP